jgi:hypothetical protein
MQRSWRLMCSLALCAMGVFASRVRADGPDVPEDKSWAFSYDDHGFKDGSETDLRSLNENVAGEHGFVRLSADKQSSVATGSRCGSGRSMPTGRFPPMISTSMPASLPASA